MVKLTNLPLKGLSTKYPLNGHIAGITELMRLTHLGSGVCIAKTIETASQAKKLALRA
jgi:hypothetical protein